MPDRPNFLIIQGEDAGRHLGCYGDPDAKTPHLDALAARGCRFDNGFSTAPVCAPSRGAMVSGRYGWTLGNHHMRSTLAQAPRTFTEELREQGYYVAWSDKTDFNFPPRDGHADAMMQSREKWASRLRRGELGVEQPFLCYANLHVTHESTMWGPAEGWWGRCDDRIRSEHRLSPDQRVNPWDVRVPAYLPDTFEVRTDIARFYEALALADLEAAEILDALDASGQRDNTYVIFLTDHGRGLPREKRWCYGAGVHLSLLVAGPEITPGSVSEELISWVDLAPTLLSLAGAPIPGAYEGQVFLGDEKATPREHIVAGRDRMDNCFDRQRCVRDKQYHYLRNFYPQLPYMQRLWYMERMSTTKVLREYNRLGRLNTLQAPFMAAQKPVEELYDAANDPDMVHNLASDPAHTPTLARFRDALARHQAAHPDLAEKPERELIEAGIVVDRLPEFAKHLDPLPDGYELGQHRKPVLEMPQ